MFIKHESVLLAVLKASLVKMYSVSFKNLNLDNSTLLNSQSSQQLTSFFSKRPGNSFNTSTQLKSLEDNDKDETASVKDKKEKKRIRKVTTSDSDSSEETKSHLSPKTKLPKISMYFSNESVVGKKVYSDDANNRELFTARDKENFYQTNIGGNNKVVDGNRYKSPAADVANVKSINHQRAVSSTIESLNSYSIESPAMVMDQEEGTIEEERSSGKSNKGPSLFEKQIGSNDLNESMANRIDLHMCNRETSFVEPPAPRPSEEVVTSKNDNVIMLLIYIYIYHFNLVLDKLK